MLFTSIDVDECGVALPLCESPCSDVVLLADLARRVVVTHVADDVHVGKG